MHYVDLPLTQLLLQTTTSEEERGLTKAERAVLRRKAHGLSNNSVNGYYRQQNLDSYQRSLRLLQNVLCNVGSKMIMDTAQETEGQYTFGVQIFYPNDAHDFTCATNRDVDRRGGAYATSKHVYAVTSDNINPTIEDIMNSAGIKYKTVSLSRDIFIASITIDGQQFTADLIDSCYDLKKHPDADKVFWFYSINGTANPGNSGQAGQSFTTVRLTPNDTVVWQLIAPDVRYGFKSCAPDGQNKYALAKQERA